VADKLDVHTVREWFRSLMLPDSVFWIHPMNQNDFLIDINLIDMTTTRDVLLTGVVAHIWACPIVTHYWVPSGSILVCRFDETQMVPETYRKGTPEERIYQRWHWEGLERFNELWPTLPPDLIDRIQPTPRRLSNLARHTLEKASKATIYLHPKSKATASLLYHDLIERVGLDRYKATPKGLKVSQVYPSIWDRLVV